MPLVTTHPRNRSQEGLLYHMSRDAAYRIGQLMLKTDQQPQGRLWARSLVGELSVFCFRALVEFL